MKNPGNRLLFRSPGIAGRHSKNNFILHQVQKNTPGVICLLFLLFFVLVIPPAGADPSSTITPERLYADSSDVNVRFSEVNTDMVFDLFLALVYDSGENMYGYLAGEIQTDSGLGEGYIEYTNIDFPVSEPYQHFLIGELPGSQYSFMTARMDEEGLGHQLLPLFIGGNITSADEELMVIPISTDTYPPVGFLAVQPFIDESIDEYALIPYSFDSNRPIVTAADVTIEKEKTGTGMITLAPMNDGLFYYNMTVSLDTPGVARITGAQFPPGVTGNIVISDQSVVVNATCSREGSAPEIPLLSVTYLADGCCAAGIVPVVFNITDENLWPVDPTIHNGALSVTGYDEPVAAFDASPREFAAPVDVSFRDFSTGLISSWLWKFGDGGTSTDKNPVHRYQDPGTYSVNLTVSGYLGSDSCEKTGYIKAGSLPLWFYANVTSGVAPLAIQFNATAQVLPDTWSWYFGDGTISGVRNATHTYTKPGTYTVRLTATTGEKSNRLIRYNYISVTGEG